MLSRRAGWALAVPVAAVLVGYVLWPNLATFRLGLDAGVLGELFGAGRSAGTRGLQALLGLEAVPFGGVGAVLAVHVYVFYVYLFVGASLRGLDASLLDASADLGASPWTTFRRVVLPAIAPGVIAGALLTFVTALGELVASVMLYVYANRPVSVEVFAQLRIFEFGQAAAYSVLLMGLVVVSVGVSRLLGANRAL